PPGQTHEELGVLVGPRPLGRGGGVGDVLLAEPHLTPEPPEPGDVEVDRLGQGEPPARPRVAPPQVRQLVGEHPAQRRLVAGRALAAGPAGAGRRGGGWTAGTSVSTAASAGVKWVDRSTQTRANSSGSGTRSGAGAGGVTDATGAGAAGAAGRCQGSGSQTGP